MSEEDQFRANAKIVVDRFGPLSMLGAEFGYNRKSLAWIERFIDRTRDADSAKDAERLIELIGSFLGECVIRLYGGVWRERDGSWGVFFDELNAAYPFNKVRKQFTRGVSGGDSILSFFDMTPEVMSPKKK